MGILWHISRLGEKMRKQECVIKVPGLNEKFRFKVPDHMSIAEVIKSSGGFDQGRISGSRNSSRKYGIVSGQNRKKRQTEPNVLRNWKYQSKKNGF